MKNETKKSAAKTAKVKVCTLTEFIRKYILVATMCCVLVVLVGSGLNNLGQKYAVVHNSVANESSCLREIYTLNEPDSTFCCEGLRRQDWVCIAGFDHINRLMTSLPWAYILPLVPWMCTALFFPKEIPLNVHLRRLFLYLGIFLFRAFIIYSAFSKLQTFLNNAASNEQHGKCWYASLSKNNNCNHGFDFSDHVVFYIAVYTIPTTIEVCWTMHTLRSVQYRNTDDFVPWFRHVPTFASAVILSAYCARNMMFTSLYFHTPMENLVAVMLVVSTVTVPLWYDADRISRILQAPVGSGGLGSVNQKQ